MIKREWIGEEPDYVITLEKHEEDQFTVKITGKEGGLAYYSFLESSGKLTFGTLEDAQQFAAVQLAGIKAGDSTGRVK